MKKTQEKKLNVAEMRMLRWMSGVTKLDRIRNERIRGTTKVGEIAKKVQEIRLKWYGHVLIREDEYVGKRVMAMEVPGKIRRGRPKQRWLDSTRNVLSERELSREDAQDRAKRRRLIRHRPHIKVGKDEEEDNKCMSSLKWLRTVGCAVGGTFSSLSVSVLECTYSACDWPHSPCSPICRSEAYTRQ